MKALRYEDTLGKQNFHEDMKKDFETVTDTVKQTAPENTGAVKDTTKAIELQGEEAN